MKTLILTAAILAASPVSAEFDAYGGTGPLFGSSRHQPMQDAYRPGGLFGRSTPDYGRGVYPPPQPQIFPGPQPRRTIKCTSDRIGSSTYTTCR